MPISEGTFVLLICCFRQYFYEICPNFKHFIEIIANDYDRCNENHDYEVRKYYIWQNDQLKPFWVCLKQSVFDAINLTKEKNHHCIEFIKSLNTKLGN